VFGVTFGRGEKRGKRKVQGRNATAAHIGPFTINRIMCPTNRRSGRFCDAIRNRNTPLLGSHECST